jgi:hypothetical protein
MFDDWKPTAANINALPESLRRYIHDLETNCDPAGLVQQIAALKDQVNQLLALLPRTADGATVMPDQRVYIATVFERFPWEPGPRKKAYINYHIVEVMPHNLSLCYYSKPELAEDQARRIHGPDIVCVRRE